MKQPPFVFLFVVCISLTTTISCCKKNTCLTCPPLPTDTTSHNWVFDPPVLLGGGGSSALQDIQILNDTFAIAVGDVYQSGDLQSYGLAVWNGQQWLLRRVYAYTQEGYLENIRPITGVYIFSESDIWLADGNTFHWNGQDSILTSYWISGYPGNPNPVLGSNQGVNKFWGTSSQNLYGCGMNGGLAHYNGSSWTKIESGTTLDIYDIYGAYNPYSLLKWEILAVATQNYPPGRVILNIIGNTATQISTNTIGDIEELFSVWFVPCQHYYVVGDGIYEKNSLSDGAWRNGPLDITTYATTRIRGNGINDVFVVGAFGEVLHYNGSTWYSYKSTTNLSNGSYTSVAEKNNLVIAVGCDSPLAVVAVGRR